MKKSKEVRTTVKLQTPLSEPGKEPKPEEKKEVDIKFCKNCHHYKKPRCYWHDKFVARKEPSCTDFIVEKGKPGPKVLPKTSTRENKKSKKFEV